MTKSIITFLPHDFVKGVTSVCSLWSVCLYAAVELCASPIFTLSWDYFSSFFFNVSSFGKATSEMRGERRLTGAEVGELPWDAGPLVLVQFAPTAQSSEMNRRKNTA